MKHMITILPCILSLWLLIPSCDRDDGGQHRIISLYSNATFHKVPADDPLRIGVTRHIAKVHNKHDRPIVIPIDYCHKWYVERTFLTDVKGDSLIDIAGIGTSFYLDLGVDTLYPGETQRYFVDLYRLNYPLGSDAYAIIAFRYFFLDDFSKHPYDHRFRQDESFILYRDSARDLHIYETRPGFNPEVHVTHPLPAHQR